MIELQTSTFHGDQALDRCLCVQLAVLAVDVLRATATWTAIGADRPCGIHIRVKDQDGVGFMAPTPSDRGWVKAGELNGEPIPGAVMGNSPTEVWQGRFFASWVSFESTNGARAVEQAKKVPRSEIFIACLQNIDAVGICSARCAAGQLNRWNN